MSTQQNEGRGGPTTTKTPTAEGLHKDPNRIMKWSIHSKDMAEPIGYGIFEARTLRIRRNEINWIRWSTPAIHLGHIASLLVLQGLELQNFFNERCYLVPERQHPDNWGRQDGPFFFLRGQLSEVWRVPLLLTDVVLGRAYGVPKPDSDEYLEEYSREAILGAMLETVLST